MSAQTKHLGFIKNSQTSTKNQSLAQAMSLLDAGLMLKRKKAVNAVENYQELRTRATAIRQHTLEHLDVYLDMFAQNAAKNGSVVHFCETASQAQSTILKLCKTYNAKNIVKGKSMVTEEIQLNDLLAQNNIQALETDLGEYLVQIRKETPSHILAPAIHITQKEAENTFRTHHTSRNPDRTFSAPEDLVNEAREEIREHYFNAEIGITGANFLIASEGSSVIVTNEGNGDLSQHIPPVHIVVSSIDKIVPDMPDMLALLRVLGRSATGQEMSVYTTLSSGTKRQNDPDGPQTSHIIILDNGRSDLLQQEETSHMLRCIRCSACINHCPVYRASGGHAYDSPYVGPMGIILSPALSSLHTHKDLPFASSLCGTCVEVCPVSIPLTKLIRFSREQTFAQRLNPVSSRPFLIAFQFIALRPSLYRLISSCAAFFLALLPKKQHRLSHIPFLKGWFAHRNFPQSQRQTFQSLWKQYQKSKSSS
jgi:L-lactate dehydrogenase complex protein LldF